MQNFSRYSRQIILPQIGVNGQQILQDSTVLIIGLGGLGTIASLYLCGAGVGRLLLNDFDVINLNNLHRQVLYRENDIPLTKTSTAVETLRKLNSTCQVEALHEKLVPGALLEAVQQADMILDCTDNFTARSAINSACVQARKPLVSGAAIRMEGQLAAFESNRGGACYACLYENLNNMQDNCEDAGILGPVVGVIGSLQALVAIKILTGIGDNASVLHTWDAISMKWRNLNIQKNPTCKVCGIKNSFA